MRVLQRYVTTMLHDDGMAIKVFAFYVLHACRVFGKTIETRALLFWSKCFCGYKHESVRFHAPQFAFGSRTARLLCMVVTVYRFYSILSSFFTE